jgi:hypothetical protein
MSKIRPFFLFLILGVIFSVLFSSGQIENPDTHLRLTQARIFLENQHFGLPNDVGEDLHGNIAINRQGQRFMVYNPGQTILFIPIYYLAELTSNSEGTCYYKAAFLVSFVNLIVHSICCFLLFKIALSIGASINKSYFVALVFCFTSYSFSFAQSTFEHHFEMFFILLGYYFISVKNIKHNSGLLAGISIALGVIFRSTSVLALPGLLLLANNKQRKYMIIGFMPGLISILFYNYYRFNNPFESGYDLAWLLANGNGIAFWSLARIPLSIFGFLFSPAKGLIFFSPTLIFGLLGIKKFWNKHHKFTFSVIILSVLYLILFSMNFAWHGSIWSFGPRYILPILPFLYLPIIEINIKNWFYPILFIAALGQVLLITVNYKRNLLEQNIRFKGFDERQYIFSLGNIPYLVQMKQLIVILPKNVSGTLEDDFPNSAWKKEIRTASSKQVLNNSIEKNSINFWWIRIFQWKTDLIEKTSTIFLLMSAVIGCFLIFRNEKKIIK